MIESCRKSIPGTSWLFDTGAHGHAMGFNYNGKLRPAELLLKPDGKVEMIRRAETIEDYFATLDFSNYNASRINPWSAQSRWSPYSK